MWIVFHSAGPLWSQQLHSPINMKVVALRPCRCSLNWCRKDHRLSWKAWKIWLSNATYVNWIHWNRNSVLSSHQLLLSLSLSAFIESAGYQNHGTIDGMQKWQRNRWLHLFGSQTSKTKRCRSENTNAIPRCCGIHCWRWKLHWVPEFSWFHQGKFAIQNNPRLSTWNSDIEFSIIAAKTNSKFIEAHHLRSVNADKCQSILEATDAFGSRDQG